MDSRYDAWQKFCAESDRQVSQFNSEQQKCCPFCGGEAYMYWKYTDYDNFFIVECKSCEARVKTYSFADAVKQWNRRAGYENAIALLRELADAASENMKSQCYHCDLRDACQEGEDGMVVPCSQVIKLREALEKALEVLNGGQE